MVNTGDDPLTSAAAMQMNGIEDGDVNHSKYFWHGIPKDEDATEGEEKGEDDRVFAKLGHKLTAPHRALKVLSHSSDEDPSLNPHQHKEATLRRNNSLSPEELAMYTLPLSSPLTAPLSARPLLDHFKDVAGVHPLTAKAANLVAEAEGGVEAMLGPLVAKHRAGQEVCMIDLYSTLTSSYFWLLDSKKEQGRIEPASLKWSRAYEHGQLAQGKEPFPILTAVRHERPWRDWKSKEEAFEDTETSNSSEHREQKEAWWQWFEINPVEVGSEELEGWVPTWAFGRSFNKGVSTQNLPEHSLALLLGLATACPAAPLSSFLGTIWRNLPQNAFGSLLRRTTKSISKQLGDHTMDKIDNVNPVHAGNQPNPFFGAGKREGRGNGFENSPRLHLVDSGMANNCPTHVFLHPARDTDVIILFDASSDVQKGSALSRINDFGHTKGLHFRPRSPLPSLPDLPTNSQGEPVQLTAEEMRERFDGRYAQILDGEAVRKVEGRAGVVFNEQRQPQAWRDVTLVYIHDGLEVIQLAIREAYERRKAARLAGEVSKVEEARANVAKSDPEKEVFIVAAAVPDEVDGTRPWME
ncbi:FabD/lysophospholipase-like protein [Pseudohyphozyma bogoriensis]|nr:FabD/lysophospholipase-like protein [Pseudohyphozyma bogoriensis]